jgi:hypothetical protein
MSSSSNDFTLSSFLFVLNGNRILSMLRVGGAGSILEGKMLKESRKYCVIVELKIIKVANIKLNIGNEMLL